MASGYTAFMSTMITRGTVVWGVCKSLRKKRSSQVSSNQGDGFIWLFVPDRQPFLQQNRCDGLIREGGHSGNGNFH